MLREQPARQCTAGTSEPVGVLKAGDTEPWGLELFCGWSRVSVRVGSAGHDSQ